MRLVPRIVLYHDICSDPPGAVKGLRVSTPIDLFREHIEWFRDRYTPIRLEQLRLRSFDSVASVKHPPLLITFDDCYRSVVKSAGPILKEFEVPALFFVNSGPVNDRLPLLDNLLCLIAHIRGLEAASALVAPSRPAAASLAELVGRMIAEFAYHERQSLYDRLVHSDAVEEASIIKASDLYCSADDLKCCADLGIDLGNHTRSHPHMRSLRENDFEAEVERCGRFISSEFGGYSDAFSVPYGSRADAQPRVLELLRDAGVQDVFLVHSVRNRSEPTRGTWYRTSLVDDPVESLRKKIEWLPRLRRVRDTLKGKG